MKKRFILLVSLMVSTGTTILAQNQDGSTSNQQSSSAQTQATTPQGTSNQSANSSQKSNTSSPVFTKEQLETALAPIALYPDSLLAQLLMASTYPEQVIEAAKWSKEHPKLKGEEAVKAVQDKNWDASVASLVAFPQVLELLSSKPEWVKELGDMFLADPDAVMLSIQDLRRKAKEAGNLKSTKEQKVVEKSIPVQSDSNSKSSSSSSGGSSSATSQTVIEIHPSNPEVVYVPTYNPTVVYGSWPYPSPPYYYQPPHWNPVGAIIGFGAAIAVGHALWSHCDWHHRDVNINVNRYNNINVNRRINNIDNRRASWRRDVRVNNPRYNKVINNRQRIGNNVGNRVGNRVGDNINKIGNDKRVRPAVENRARDLQRDRARQELKQKGGVDLEKARKNLQQNPERVNRAINRAKDMTPAQREQVKNRINNKRPATRDVKRPSPTRDVKRPSATRDVKTPRQVSKRPTTNRATSKRPVNTNSVKRATPRPKPSARPKANINRPAKRPAPSRPTPRGAR